MEALERNGLMPQLGNTAYSAVISSNLLMWKFSGNTLFPQSFGRIVQNSAVNMRFHKMSISRKLGEISIFAQLGKSCLRFWVIPQKFTILHHPLELEFPFVLV